MSSKQDSITKNQAKAGKAGLSMRVTLILFALLPLIVSSTIIGFISILRSKAVLKDYTHDSFVQVITEIGNSFDTIASKNGEALKGFASAPVVKEALLNPKDSKTIQKAQQYTLDYFGSLEGWEGLYFCDWDSKVLTHPSAPVIGMVLREGDRLTSLQNSMLSASNGVFNTGVMTSPASGQIIMSLYTPVLDNGKPIGFAGGAFYVNDIASKLADVSHLNIGTAYVYFVDSEGTMLYHPDQSKIGNPVENDAVKNIIARIKAGENIEPTLIEYNYNGAMKYAGCYVGEGGHYIAVLTADENDVLSAVRQIMIATIVIILICIGVFTVIAILVERLISVPLISISHSLEKLSTGDVASDCNAKTHIRETASILKAFKDLRSALNRSMSTVNSAAGNLNDSILSVDGMTGNNVNSVSQINVAINEVAQTSQSVATEAQVLAEKASNLGENVEALNQNVENLHNASQTIKVANNEATECMRSVYSSANESVNAMEEITSKINDTNSAIGDIGTAIQAIESIAAQTNLLSLNASIEAARAGEAGRGFAVVADEIRALADSSAESAKEIKDIIENVITLSNGTVQISNRVFDVINREKADIEAAQEKFNTLSDSVEASITEIETIRRMAESLDRIKEEMTNSTSDLGAISEELGASAEEVAASCQTVTDACTDTQASTATMRTVNDDMREAISFFKL